MIPVFNEEATIEEIIKRVQKAGIDRWEKEIIVVDDGSTDNTRRILEALQAPLIKIFLPTNRGKGSAVRAGIQAASGSHILIQDADLEYDPQDIQLLMRAIDEEKSDVVYGSRNLSPHTRRGGLLARIGVHSLTQGINLLYGLHLTDIWSGYKLFPRTAADLFVDGGFEAEIVHTILITRAGYSIGEVPISYYPRSRSEGKKIRYRDGFRAWICILKMYMSR